MHVSPLLSSRSIELSSAPGVVQLSLGVVFRSYRLYLLDAGEKP